MRVSVTRKLASDLISSGHQNRLYARELTKNEIKSCGIDRMKLRKPFDLKLLFRNSNFLVYELILKYIHDYKVFQYTKNR